MLRVRLLGEIAVEADGRPVAIPPGRPLELLVWLAAHPGRHPRSRLAPAFWPDISDEASRASLRTALWALRRALGPQGDRALVVDRGGVELGGDDLEVDLREMRLLAESGELARALELGDAELLPGMVSEWADEAREDHRRQLAKILTALAREAEGDGDVTVAIASTRRLAELDPYSEDVHRTLLRRLRAAGDGAGALVAHARFRRRLWEELRAVPSATTTALANEIAGGGPGSRGTSPHLPSRLEAADGEPFVGRTAALETLRGVWARRGARPQLVLVRGEAGIGKTRLAARFAAEVQEGGGQVRFGSASEDRLVPGEPFVEALGLESSDAPDQLVESVRRQLATVSRSGSVLLVLDDLHWADTITLALLRRVARGGFSPPVVPLVTCREGEDVDARLSATVADLSRDCEITRLRLGGLSVSDTAELLAALSSAPGLAADADRIHARTGGNPFFARELASFLRSQADDRTGSEETVIPESVRDLVASRVQRLSPAARWVLTVAAVMGVEFDRVAVEAVAGVGTEALDALDELLSTGLVVERSAGVFAFSHALARDAVYSTASRSRRADLHRRTGEVLAERHGEEPGPHLYDIALHRCAAVPAVSAGEAVIAAQEASAWELERQVYDRAVIVLTRALAVAEERDRAALQARRAVAFQRLTHLLLDPASVRG